MPNAFRLRAVAGVVVAAAASLPVQASQAERAGPPLWEIGGFALGVSQQAYPGSDTQLHRALALPYVIYRGKVLRADRETAGLRALKTERLELDLGVAGSFGGGDDEIDVRRGMRELGTLVELGPRVKLRLGEDSAGGRWRLDLPLRGVFDLNDRGRHRGMAFEPELVFERQTASGWRYSSSVSLIMADRRLAEHFYSVRAEEATPARAAYSARAGLVASRLSLSATRSLGNDWRVFGFARYDSVSGAANEGSPLVRQTGGATLGLGLAYAWMRSQERAHD